MGSPNKAPRALLLYLLLLPVWSPGMELKGSLFGKVVSEKGNLILDSCIIRILPIDTAITTDSKGRFYVENLPVGVYSILTTRSGFIKNKRNSVRITSGRAEEILIELKPAENAFSDTLRLEEKIVTEKSSTGLRARGHETVGTYRLTREEILSATGTLLDISRTIQYLPGMTRNNDQSTNLIVRGGAPDEVSYLIDGIPIFSINHFEFGRNKRGEIGNINMYFLDHIDFHNGAFAARYPDKMSGVMDIHFKKGDPRKISGLAILDAAGTGGVLEGPVPGSSSNGTYGATFRYSSLGLLDKTGAIDFGGVPQYQNAHIKLNYQTGKSNWNFNLLAATDEFVSEQFLTTYRNNLGPQGQYKTLREGLYFEDSDTRNTFGSLRWTHAWDRSSTTIYAANNTRFEIGESFDSIYVVSQDSTVFPDYHILDLKESNEGVRWLYGLDQKHFLNERVTLQYGIYQEHTTVEHHTDNREELYFRDSSQYQGFGADSLSSILEKRDIRNSFYDLSLYSELIYQVKHYELYLGARYLYDEFTADYEVGPRAGVKIFLGKQILKYAGGFHSQSEAPNIFALTNPPKRLPVSVHNVVGWEGEFNSGILATLEFFNKETYHVARFRQNPDNPPQGKTISRGFDASIKKTLLKSFWTSIAYTYSWNREWHQEKWIRTIYSIPHYATSALGFEFNKIFSGSVRYSYATGSPHASSQVDSNTAKVTYEFELNDRFLDYHRLDIRMDYRKNFKKMSLAVLVEITNVLNRHNEFVWFNGTDKSEGWTLFPVAGFALSF